MYEVTRINIAKRLGYVLDHDSIKNTRIKNPTPTIIIEAEVGEGEGVGVWFHLKRQSKVENRLAAGSCYGSI